MPNWGQKPVEPAAAQAIPAVPPPPATGPAPAVPPAAQRRCHDTAHHYKTEVNKGSIRMSSWEADLNKRYRDGYRLAHVFEQDGNTVQVFEHHGH